MLTASRLPGVFLLTLATLSFSLVVADRGVALAADFSVNSTADTGECASTCTLRGAINAASKSADASSTILVPAGTYELGAFEEAHPISTGQLRLTNPAGTTVRIEGAGVGTTIIDAAKRDRVLRIGGGGTDVLAGLTLEDGFPGGNPKDNDLEESVSGAGIYQASGKVTLEHVRVDENQDSGFGGGVDVVNNGTLTLVDSELDHDVADDGWGGAVSLEPGTLTAIGSSLDGDNSPTGVGGAVALHKHSTATFTNDTLADNGFVSFGDTYEGGAMFLEESSAVLVNVTFAGNGAFGNTNGGSDISANESSHLTFTNVLLGHGLEAEPGEQACNERFNESGTKLSTWTDLGGNLSDDGTCHLTSVDAERELKLGELGSYGGPTRTVPLLEGSPAIDFGVTGCPVTDQREYARVEACDSGAFEFAAVPTIPGGGPAATTGSSTTGSSSAGTSASATTAASTAGIATTPAAVEELLLGCSKTQLVLNDAYIHAGRVLLVGSAAKSLTGKKVKILFNERKQVASATVGANGQFTTTAPLPPAKIREALTTRYTAEVGKVRSLHLKLTRRLLLEPPKASGTTVTLSGQVTLPLTKPAAPVVVEQQLECGKTTVVKTFTPPANGRFEITLTVPANARAGIYRLISKVAANAHAVKHGFTTFSLPLPVALG